MQNQSPVAADGEAEARGKPVDSGIIALITLLAYFDLPADAGQIAHEFASSGEPISSLGLVAASRARGLKARLGHKRIADVTKLPLPAIIRSREARFLILAKAAADRVLVKEAGKPPAEWTMDQLAAEWSGEIILLARRANIAAELREFGLGWFLPVVSRFRGLFAEVLVASFFLQMFGLATPLFSQVVIDKVLVHRGLTTLDVLVVGLILLGLFEVTVGGLRNYIFAHTTSRIDVLLGARLFKHLLALPISYFESRQTGQTVARVRELEHIRDFLTSSSLTLVIDLFFCIVFLAVMYWYSATLTWIVLASIPFYVALAVVVTPMLRARVEEKFQRGAQNQSFLVESISAV